MQPYEIKRDLIAALPRLRRFARSLVAGAEEADELLRRACLGLVERGARPPVERRAFLTLRELAERDGPAPPADGGEAGFRDAALGLPPGLASALILVAVEGCGRREAARILGVPEDMVARRLARARRLAADMREEERREAERRLGGGWR